MTAQLVTNASIGARADAAAANTSSAMDQTTNVAVRPLHDLLINFQCKASA